jgi:hypothetical protein
VPDNVLARDEEEEEEIKKTSSLPFPRGFWSRQEEYISILQMRKLRLREAKCLK